MLYASVLVAAMAAGLATPAQAQVYWPEQRSYRGYYDNGYGRYVGRRYDDDDFPDDMRMIERSRPRLPRTTPLRATRTPKLPDAPKDGAKPQGPLVIAISLDRQRLKLYDANGLFAESPVSTGMRGHATPMGVFSIIQKNKYHRSNIYSGAPMPYMQRITWSGIALHAGVLPGYPASHGCIRMPTNFAMRLWGWTRMGARVIITPGEISPADFENAKLVTRKATPVAADQLKPDGAVATQAAADTSDLRTVSLADNDKPVRTADAGSTATQTSDVAGGTSSPADAMTAATAPAPDAAPAAPPVEGSAEFIGPVKPRSGHLAVYISRKENKLFVRQNFEPWFETPVTIAPSDRPLGTHVFTARADKDNAGALRWSVVSLPAHVRTASLDEDMPRRRRHATIVDAAVALPPSSPTEALDRVTIPPDAMQRITAALAPGGSIVVSDHGLGGETGRGTDFIVPLR
jgi:hypothetical protein